MGFLDFLRPARADPERAPHPTDIGPGGARGGMFSIADTDRLHQLFKVPVEQRSAPWRAAFFEACWNASMILPEPAHFDGPDGLPYFRLNLPRPGMRFEAHCLAGIARTCLDRNAGVAFFGSASDPADASQWVMSMGEIDSWLRFGSGDGDPIDAEAKAMVAADLPAGPPPTSRSGESMAAQAVLVASPSRDLVPEHTARALCRLIASWGEADPRIGLVVDPGRSPARTLVIGRKVSDFSSEPVAAFELSRAAWMLPPNRGVMLMPEDWSLRDLTRLSAFVA